MKIANISTIKNELSKYLRYVQQGERVRILDRNQAVADLVPVSKSESTGTESYLSTLETKAIIRRGTAVCPPSLKRLPQKPSQRKAAGVLEALLKERKEGR